MRHIINGVLMLIGLLHGSTANGQEWKKMASEGANFYEIERSMASYFAATPDAPGSKQYTRWARKMAPRVYPSGRILNGAAIRFEEHQRLMVRQPPKKSRSTHGEWENIGPFDYVTLGGGSALGRLNRITFHPTNASEFWVGSAAGGLWRTTDNGASWTPRTDGLPSIGISGMCVDPADPSVQYILTGDGDGADTWSIGVVKSTDHGFNWFPTPMQFTDSANVLGVNLLMDLSSPNVLLAATTVGLWMTTDGAATWNLVDTVANSYWDIEFAPGNAQIVYASTNLGLRISNDGGFTWSSSSDPSLPVTGSFTRIEIATSPSVDSTVYLLYGGGPTGFAGLFRSTDFGSTFSMMSNTPNIMGGQADGSGTRHQADYDIALAVDPQNDSILYVGGINVWKSQNAGSTWQLKTDWQRAIPFIAWIHADIHELQFNNGILYACNDGGIFKSEDGGDNWDDLSKGLSITQFYYIDINDNDYIGGSQDNGTYGADVLNPQARNILDGDGFSSIYHYGNTDVQYISNQNNKVRRQSGSGINQTITPSGLVPKGSNFQFWDEDMDMHTKNPDFVFMGNWELFKGNGDPFSFSWDSMYTTFSCVSTDACRITTISQGISDDNIMYISNEQEILRSDNINSATPTWTSLPSPDRLAVTDILIDPNNVGRIWCSLSGYLSGQKLFFSSDSGSTWINQSGNLPNVPANCLFFEPGSSDGIYIGTDIGVFYRNSAFTDWIYFSNGLPNTPITDMDVENGFLYVGTYGRGIWRTESYTTCPSDLILTTANDPSIPFSTGSQVYHASNSITSTRILNGGIGTDVQYTAGNYIDLTIGFWAKSGNLMRAKIGGCLE